MNTRIFQRKAIKQHTEVMIGGKYQHKVEAHYKQRIAKQNEEEFLQDIKDYLRKGERCVEHL